MPLVLVVGVGFSILLAAFVLQGMQQGGPYWLKALLNAMAHPHGSWIKRTALKAAALIGSGLVWIYHVVMHALSVATSHAMHQATQWFDSVANTILHSAATFQTFAEDTAASFERLVSHTIPRAVHKAIAVPLHEVRLGLRDLHRTYEQLRRYARGIDRLVARRVLPAIRAAEHAIAVTIPRELGRIRARERAAERAIRHPSRAWIKRIWRAGWVLVGAGLMVRFLTRKFPYLFCRNSTNALKAVCGMDSLLLDALLLETTAIVGAISVVEFAKDLQEVEGEAVDLLRGLIKEL
jgi:hypothetical protein